MRLQREATNSSHRDRIPSQNFCLLCVWSTNQPQPTSLTASGIYTRAPSDIVTKTGRTSKFRSSISKSQATFSVLNLVGTVFVHFVVLNGLLEVLSSANCIMAVTYESA